MMRKRVITLFSRICIIGAALTLLLAGVTVFVFVHSGQSLFPERGGDRSSGESFYQKLKNYDEFSSGLSPSFEELRGRLDALEKDALGTESHLSVLKRRRALASGNFSGGRAAYLAAAERTAAKFPHTETILAVAAEAASRSGSREKALEYAAGLTDGNLLPLALGAAALAGALETPEKAVALERSGELLLAAQGGVNDANPIGNRNGFIIDAAIVRILTGDTRRAGELIRPLLDSGPEKGASRDAALRETRRILNFAAEYYYDFGDLRRAAEIFARINTEESMVREADALALAGEREQVKGLWTVLSSPDENGVITTAPEILIRSLYNLAAAAETPEEETALIQRALSLDGGHLYALIRYTRLLPTERALDILDNSGLARTEPLIDLEILKRCQENWPLEKAVPETWLLLNRHNLQASEEPPAPLKSAPPVPLKSAPPTLLKSAPPTLLKSAILYRWACYYFDFQKQYGETARLIRAAERNGLSGPWLDFHRALALVRQNKTPEAEVLLLAIEEEYGRGGKQTGYGFAESGAGVPAIIAGSGFWQVPANLGRIREASRSLQDALDFYETAAARVKRASDAARIYYRIARCLRTLGRDSEARDAVEHGLSLDGENLSLRLELTRLNDLGIF